MPLRRLQHAANQEFLDPDHFGLLCMELFPDHYSWSFIRGGGEVVTPDPHEAECQES